MQKILLSACVFIGFVIGSLWAGEIPRKVDINTASIAELDTLPGIGPAIAARIIDYRTRNGPFRRSEDVMNVRGIGEKKFLKLKDRIVLSLSQSQTTAKTSRPSSGGKTSQKPPPKRK